jgi:hypothetical protein
MSVMLNNKVLFLWMLGLSLFCKIVSSAFTAQLVMNFIYWRAVFSGEPCLLLSMEKTITCITNYF